VKNRALQIGKQHRFHLSVKTLTIRICFSFNLLHKLVSCHLEVRYLVFCWNCIVVILSC